MEGVREKKIMRVAMLAIRGDLSFTRPVLHVHTVYHQQYALQVSISLTR